MGSDTIAAIATAPGRGGVGIVRVSGPGCRAIAEALLGRVPEPRRAELHRFRGIDGEPVDEGLALFFPAPASFTGEDVLEFQGHGGPSSWTCCSGGCSSGGAPRRTGRVHAACVPERQNRPGAGRSRRRPDRQRLGAGGAGGAALPAGEFSSQVHDLAEAVLELRMWVEAAIDFPEEEVDFLGDRALDTRCSPFASASPSSPQPRARARCCATG